MGNTMAVLAVLFIFMYSGGESGTDTFVTTRVAVKDSVVRAGSEGTILISFVPVDGIHITSTPAVTMSLEKNSPFAIRKPAGFKTDKKTGFLATSSPVEQRFVVAKDSSPGTHVLRGTITYYFCSDEEGWCRKSTHPVELKLTIVKR